MSGCNPDEKLHEPWSVLHFYRTCINLMKFFAFTQLLLYLLNYRGNGGIFVLGLLARKLSTRYPKAWRKVLPPFRSPFLSLVSVQFNRSFKSTNDEIKKSVPTRLGAACAADCLLGRTRKRRNGKRMSSRISLVCCGGTRVRNCLSGSLRTLSSVGGVVKLTRRFQAICLDSRLSGRVRSFDESLSPSRAMSISARAPRLVRTNGSAIDETNLEQRLVSLYIALYNSARYVRRAPHGDCFTGSLGEERFMVIVALRVVDRR